ncbi:hypothetical protein QQ045_033345 [Rhodiola kirilowii]
MAGLQYNFFPTDFFYPRPTATTTTIVVEPAAMVFVAPSSQIAVTGHQEFTTQGLNMSYKIGSDPLSFRN